jgi:hypothetical protein
LDAPPDAVSGVDSIPLPADQREGVNYDSSRGKTLDEKIAEFEKLPFEEQEKQRTIAEHQAATEARAEQLAESQRDLQRQTENYFNLQKVQIQAQSTREKIDADAKQIAQLNPNRVYQNMPTWAKLTGLLSSVVSGAAGGYLKTGRNLAMEEIDKGIDADIEAQKFNIGNQRADIAQRRQGVTEQLGEALDQYHQAELYRQSVYQRAMSDLATKGQDYDPQGQIVREIAKQHQMFAVASQQAADAHQQRTIKTGMDLLKSESEAAEKLASTEKIKAETDKIRGKLGGAGVGGNTNPDYTVATGFFDPYELSQPVMGRRQVGGKGEDPKERQELESHLAMYKHVNDELAQMRAIADEIGGGGKGWEESMWKGRKTTLAASYDAHREALTSYLTKAIGDRPTSGQLELQAKRIPERASVFEARDPGKLLQDQQEATDAALAADLGVIGVNAAPVIRHAQISRAAPPPSDPSQDVLAAQQAEASAQTPSEHKSATAQRSAAEARLQQQLQDEEQSKFDIVVASKLQRPDHDVDTTSLNQADKSKGEIVNRTANVYDQMLKKFRDASAATGYLKGIKGAGDKAAAEKAHGAAVAKAARDAIAARKKYDDERSKLGASSSGWVLQAPAASAAPRGIGEISRDMPEDIKPPFGGD